MIDSESSSIGPQTQSSYQGYTQNQMTNGKQGFNISPIKPGMSSKYLNEKLGNSSQMVQQNGSIQNVHQRLREYQGS
jgi:hypothetical protein